MYHPALSHFTLLLECFHYSAVMWWFSNLYCNYALILNLSFPPIVLIGRYWKIMSLGHMWTPTRSYDAWFDTFALQFNYKESYELSWWLFLHYHISSFKFSSSYRRALTCKLGDLSSFLFLPVIYSGYFVYLLWWEGGECLLPMLAIARARWLLMGEYAFCFWRFIKKCFAFVCLAGLFFLLCGYFMWL